MTFDSDALASRLNSAWIRGSQLQLDGHEYSDSRPLVPGYYHLLAGLVSNESMTQVVEIGTHHGGSALAMHTAARVSGHALHLATVDVERMSGAGRLHDRVGVRTVIGDALAEATVRAVCTPLSPPIDLLFVDAEHRYGPTLEAVATYAERLRPRWIALDDIELNDDMRAVWRRIVADQPERTIDASAICGRETGFGVFAPSTPLPPWERGPYWRSRMRRMWNLERIVAAHTPEPCKPAARRAQRVVWRLTRH